MLKVSWSKKHFTGPYWYRSNFSLIEILIRNPISILFFFFKIYYQIMIKVLSLHLYGWFNPPPPPFCLLFSGRAHCVNFVKLNFSMTHTVTLNLYCICYFYFASRLHCDSKQHNMLPFNFIICHLHRFFSLFCNSYINGTARISIFKTGKKKKWCYQWEFNSSIILQLLVEFVLRWKWWRVWRETPLIVMT